MNVRADVMTMATINVDKTCSVLPISSRNNQETSLLNDCDINKILGRKLGNAANFRLVCWRLKLLDESKGFLGQYYRLHVMVRVDGKTESLQFFAKCPPPSHSPQVSFLERCDTYNKKIGVYTDLAQRMGASESPRWMVECYFCKPNIIIVLEDVSLDGYIMPDKYVPFDEEHCVWLLRSLARLHSKSLILDERLRQESGTILDFYGHLLKEVFLIENDNLTQTLIISSSKSLCAMVDITEELDDEGKAIVKRQINEWYPKITQVIKMLRGYRHVACHRDVWANNTLFRYDAVGKPNGCYLVDFQFLCYAPPAIDFMCCLYLTTTRAIRDQNLDSFAKIYYDFFARNLAEESFDVIFYPGRHSRRVTQKRVMSPLFTQDSISK